MDVGVHVCMCACTCVGERVGEEAFPASGGRGAPPECSGARVTACVAVAAKAME